MVSLVGLEVQEADVVWMQAAEGLGEAAATIAAVIEAVRAWLRGRIGLGLVASEPHEMAN